MGIVYLSAVFIVSCYLFYRKKVGNKIGPWKATGLSILVIFGVMYLSLLLDVVHRSVIMTVTVICSIFVTARYYDYLVKVYQIQKNLYVKKEG